MKNISLDNLEIEAFNTLKRKMVVTSGTFSPLNYNSMTADWGFFGRIWNKKCVFLAIRPSRYTCDFLLANDDFTVSLLPNSYEHVVMEIGSKTGRNTDKMKQSGLTPIKSSNVASPSFSESSKTYECKKIFVTDLSSEDILVPEVIEEWYPDGDFHKFFIGEIVGITENDQNK